MFIRRRGRHAQGRRPESQPDRRAPIGMPGRPDVRMRYAPGLDGVRAFAVTAVLLYHLGTTGLVFGGGADPVIPAPGGFLGVDVFFVLSGYLITSLLLAERARTGGISIGAFYLRRARRLLPALYTMLAVVCVVAAFVLTDYAARLRGDVPAALAYVTNWWLVAGGTSYFGAGAHPPLLTHLWSLALEEQFYLVWPLALIALTRLRRRGPVLAVVAAVVIGSTVLAAVLYSPWEDPSRIYYGTDTRLATPLLGALLAIVYRPWLARRAANGGAGGTSDRTPGRTLLAAAGGAGMVALAAACVFLDDHSPVLYRGGFLGIAALAGLVVLAAGDTGGGLARVLGVAPLRWLGERSYAVYLWHWPIFAVTQPGVNIPLGPVETTVIRILATLIAADLSYRFVEVPMRSGALGRALARVREAAGARAVMLRLQAGGVAVAVAVATLFVGVHIALAAAPADAPVGPGPDTSLGALDLSPSPGVPSGHPSATPTGTPKPGKTPTTPAGAPVPRVAVFGDSQGMTLLINVPKDTGKYVHFVDDTIEGCGFLVGKVKSRTGERRDLTSDCSNWHSVWASRAKRDKPDVALIMVGAWDVFDLTVGGATLAFGSAAWDAHYAAQLDSAVAALHASVAHVAISLLPCYRPVKRSAGYWPERGDDDRTRHVNTLLEAAAAAHPEYLSTVDPPHQFCDDPKISTSLSYRWDGVHYYKPGALLYCKAVIPQLLAIVAA